MVSLFLDMSVNENNKRTHTVFLNQKRAQFEELDGGLRVDDPEVASTFERVRSWLENDFDEANRGVVIYAELGGEWMEAVQFPVSVQNRLVVGPRPVIAPLAQVLESYHHYGVILLDREHVRILSVYLGTLLDEINVRPNPIPTPHDVHAGGYSQERFQRRKREEMKHFFKDFCKEVEDFVARYRPDDLVILGTDENVAAFREFLPDSILQKVVHTGPMEIDDPASEILQRLEPHLRTAQESASREVIEQVRDRVAHDYLATAGFQGTLTALQEGKVDTLLLASDQRRDGVRCGQCGFVFARDLKTCPYDGSSTLQGVDVVEEMVRMAEGQGVAISFADPQDVQDLKGAGALLRF
ncbi:MAG TPA: VLRF1 family aeRF1-type release factor [Longimicrobiaceae bacterium]|nr:VLRF1 family aeRF1-type release factor [Longimicrobiaceae bacterium]